jgi:formate hydrogenlyase transcriptional activator
MADNKLQKGEGTYGSLIDLAPDPTYLLDPDGKFLSANIAGLELLGYAAEELDGKSITNTYLPEDLASSQIPLEKWKLGILRFERIFVRRDGSTVAAEVSLSPMTSEGRLAIVRDVSERKRAAAAMQTAFEKVRKSEDSLRLVLDTIPAMVWCTGDDFMSSFYNRRWLDYTGLPLEKMLGHGWKDTVHPEDLAQIEEKWRQCVDTGEPFEQQARMRGADGTYRWFLDRTVPLRDQTGRVVRWYGVNTDIEEYKQAEAKIRQHEPMLRQVMDVAPLHMFIWEADASASYGNRAALEYFGPIPPKPPMEFLEIVTHPDDVEKLKEGIVRAMSRGKAAEMEARMRRHDGQYRWFLYQIFPLQNAEGQIVRWCGTRIDIDERKRGEERAHKENLALREEIDKVLMFEEIVGTSQPLQAALARVARVAGTDSTVLITGETGTGKELIARAIHKRSKRSARAFVSVNCAAIPRDLVASELFGHEKGAFTGATQRRMGCFELADGGTIFLDEIGELPAETQVALLRVLQEREFQRVGGSHSIRADVRVIAATNRDLPGAIAAGTFRSDLFYRINVFPIEIPPLRERREDIRMLVEYFIDRYSSKAGKKIRRIDKKSLDRLQSYPWPGNIRELQNVIERSVILCDTEDFSVDESWLSLERQASRPLPGNLQAQEKEIIEAALAETAGRVSGPSGAAAKLGIPATTLDSKIKSLKINKRRFHAS